MTYHSQTNDSSKRINQIVEIAIKYFVIKFSNIDYTLTLFAIQIQLNNTFNIATNLSFNEIIYEFKIKNAISSLIEINTANVQNLSTQRMKYQRKIVDVTNFAIVKIKIYYDSRHTSIRFKQNEKTYLQLNKNYKLSDKSNSKLSQQRCESFRIFERIERLAYKLKLSST